MSDVLAFAPTRLFSPEQTRAMGEAFDFACSHIDDAGMDGPDNELKRELIAHCILELADRGETDAGKMTDRVMSLIRL